VLFLKHPDEAAISFVLLCLLFLMLHMSCEPFRSAADNRLETVSLCALTTLAILVVQNRLQLSVGVQV
jgi:hypothetical protein